MTLEIFARVCSFHVFFSQKMAVPSIQISNIISKYLWHFVVLRTQLPYQTCISVYSFKLRHPRQISERGHSFVIFLSRCITTFWLFVLVYVCTVCPANFWVSCRNFGGIALMRSLNITVFRNIVYILVTRGHVISKLARRFRQILRVRLSPIFSKIIWTNPELCAC